MPRSSWFVPVLLVVLTLAHATAIASGPSTTLPTYKIDAGTTSLDGRVGIDGVFPISAMQQPIGLGDYQFNTSPSNCITQGWTSHDITGADGQYWHVDDFAGLGGGSFGRLIPISGPQSLWCGARVSATDPLCSYACLPGYGNSWDQGWCTKACLGVGSNLTVSFAATWDTEPGYDYFEVEYDDGCNDDWVRIAGGPNVWDGIGSVSASILIPDVDHGPTVRVRLRFVSDPAWSDEDCLWDTDGAVIVDDLRIDDTGVVLAVEDFEGESPGDLVSDDWEGCAPSGYGDFACLFDVFSGIGLVQDVPLNKKNFTCMWGFFCTSAYNYGCGGHASQKAVPYENSDGEFIHNEIWSPWMTFAGPSSYTTNMEFDVYRDLKLDAAVFYYWRVRSRSTLGGCADAWYTNNFVYYGGVDWYTHPVNLTPYLPFGGATAEIQVALGVIDLCEYWCPIPFSGACHSHSPMFDNVSVYRKNTQNWVVEDMNLFQDAFPQDGTTTGTVRADTPVDDAAKILVTEPSVGIDELISGMPASGPAVFCHVRNLPGKSGSAVSGGPAWPEVPSMSTTDWTVLQMAEGTELNSYTIDLNDNLFTPGDTIEFYFSARDKTPHTSYYSHLIGRTDAEALAQESPMEMTCLPATVSPGIGILYVDYYDGYGADPYFLQAFDLMDIEVNRFDRRAPSSGFSNSLSDQVAALSQIQGYDIIMWNTGSLETGCFATGDYKLLFDYLNLTLGVHGLFLSGDNVATELALSGDTYAGLLKSVFLNYTLVSSNHRDLGEMVNPLVIGETGGYFDHPAGPDSVVAFGGHPALSSFDVITPTGPSTLEMSYSGNTANGAVVLQQTLGGGGYEADVLMAGFSFHHLRDEHPRGLDWTMDRVDFMRNALIALQRTPIIPVDADDTPVAYGLSQNYPNPFNPVTTIEYSLRETGPVRIVVYDVGGRLVRVLVDEKQAGAKRYTVSWDGRNGAGARVATGVYFYRMTAGEFSQTRKMVLLK